MDLTLLLVRTNAKSAIVEILRDAKKDRVDFDPEQLLRELADEIAERAPTHSKPDPCHRSFDPPIIERPHEPFLPPSIKPPPTPVETTPTAPELVVLEETVSRLERTCPPIQEKPMADRVLEAIGSGINAMEDLVESLSTKDALGYKRVSNAIVYLVKKGAIRRIDRGRYEKTLAPQNETVPPPAPETATVHAFEPVAPLEEAKGLAHFRAVDKDGRQLATFETLPQAERYWDKWPGCRRIVRIADGQVMEAR